MIKIHCARKDNQIIELSIKGHANSNEYGKDLVCAAVTGICVGGVNALREENFQIEIEEGNMLIRALKDTSYEDQIVLNTMLAQLKALAKGQSKFISISERNN